MLFLLQLMHIYWTIFIYNVIWGVIKKKKIESVYDKKEETD